MPTPSTPSANSSAYSKPLIMPSSPIEKAAALPLWRLGIALQVLLALLTVLLTRMEKQPACASALLPIWLLAFVPYVLALGRARQLTPSVTLRGIFLFAIFFRATLWFAPPMLSNEVNRSLWEGRAQMFGHNPYLEAPSSPRVSLLAPEMLRHVTAPDMPAVSPPLSELLFHVIANISPRDPNLLKALLAFVDLGVVWLLVRLLRLRGLNENMAILYAWCPLPIVEFAGDGHFLTLAMFLSLSAVYLATPQAPRRRWAGVIEQTLAAASLAGAVCTHYFALPLLPLVMRQIKARYWLLVLLIAGLFYLPFIGAGVHLFDGLRQCVASLRFNDSAFGLLAALFDTNWTPQLPGGVPLTHAVPKLIAAGLWLAALVAVIVLRVNTIRSFYIVTGVFLLLSPVLHPHYVAFVVPFLCFYPNPGWMLLSATVLLSYWSGLAGASAEHGPVSLAVRMFEYLPALAAMVAGWAMTYLSPPPQMETRRKS
ncbi:MAG: hypothetical protein NTY01_23435 [Verrucomicrobia bacterium]|nr:hypothetical protein [Verrucomicrobiota bacterium]